MRALCDAAGFPRPDTGEPDRGLLRQGLAISPVTGRAYPGLPPRRFTRAWMRSRLEQLKGGPMTGVRASLWARICDYAARHGLSLLGPLEQEAERRLYGNRAQPSSPSGGAGAVSPRGPGSDARAPE